MNQRAILLVTILGAFFVGLIIGIGSPDHAKVYNCFTEPAGQVFCHDPERNGALFRLGRRTNKFEVRVKQ